MPIPWLKFSNIDTCHTSKYPQRLKTISLCIPIFNQNPPYLHPIHHKAMAASAASLFHVSPSPHYSISAAINPSSYVFTRSFGMKSKHSRFSRTAIVRASDEKEVGKEKDTPAFNPFGFVTDNPSSRNAIQLPESPAEDGNVGQMLYVSKLYTLSICSKGDNFADMLDFSL